MATAPLIKRVPKTALPAASDEANPESYFNLPADDLGPDSADIALMATLAQLGETHGEAKVRVYQIDQNKKDEPFLFSMGVGEFAETGLDDIQSRYGAGEYRIRVYSAVQGILTHKRVSIGAALAPAKSPEPVPMAGYPMPAPAAPDIAAMMAGQQATMMEGFRQLATMMAPAPQQTLGIRDIIELMAVMNGGSKAPAPDPIAQALQLVALRDKLAPPPMDANGEVDGSALLYKGIETFAPLVQSIMQQRQTAAQPAPAVAPVMALPNPAAPRLSLPMPADSPQQEENPVNIAFAIVKAPIIAAASANADPWNFAGMVTQFFSPDQIQHYIHAPDWFSQLCKEMPEAQQFPEWFDQLRADTLEQLAAHDEALNDLTPAAASDTVSGSALPKT